MRALSIRQPYAELILRGIKTVEYRTQPTRIIGEQFHVYAPLRRASAQDIWSRDLAMPLDGLPDWMIELAEQVGMIAPGERAGLPTGVIVGSAVIRACERIEDGGSKMAGPSSMLDPQSALFKWHLADVQRARTLRKPRGHPQPVWFKAF